MMKKIYIILALIITANISCFAQSQYSKVPHNIDKSITLDDYVGTWKYENIDTKEVFIIKLVKSTYKISNVLKDTFYVYPCIVGGYYYSVNGEVISDNAEWAINDMPTICEGSSKYTITGISTYENDIYAKLDMNFKDAKTDLLSGEFSSLEIKKSRNKPNELHWTLTRSEGAYVFIVGEEPPCLEFSVPMKMVLTKVIE